MKIKQLMIYGYGKFENKFFEFHEDPLQVIYGENEAGKSTIMSFIHSILFGFPTKQQAENRYEPKKGAAYGGYLVVEDNHQLVRIERLPGKNGGNVTIELDNGTSKGEEYLQTLMSGIDKETYRSIFSFDVHGLQQIQKINSDQIGKYLFLSSIYGADTLFSIEDKLIKQQDLLYKPSGKKPELNEGLVKLKNSHNQLMDAKRQNNEYQQLLELKEELNEELTSLTLKKNGNIKKHKELEKVLSILPLLNDREWCRNQLASLQDTEDFPEEGLKQLDQLVSTLQPMEAQLYSLNRKKEDIQLEEESLMLDEDLINIVPTIQHLREQLPVFEEKQKRLIQIQQSISKLQHEITLYKQRVLPTMNDDELLTISTTIQIKESIKKSITLDQKLKHRKQMLDEQFDRTKHDLEEAEWKLSNLKEKILPDDERLKLEEQVKTQENLDIKQLHSEKQQLISEISNRKVQFKQDKKQRTIILSILSFLLFTGSLFFLLERSWLIAVVLIVVLSLALFFFKKSADYKDPFLHHLSTKLSNIEETLNEANSVQLASSSLPEAMMIVEQDTQMKLALHHEQLLYKQYEKHYEKIVKQYEEWEEEQFQSTVTLSKLIAKLQLDHNFTSETLLEAFEIIQKLQQLILEKKQNEKEYVDLQNQVAHFNNKISEVIDRFQVEGSSEYSLYELSRRCQSEVEKKDLLLKLIDKRSETEDAIGELQEKIKYLSKQKEELISKSRCADEDDFRKLAKIHQEREELLKQNLWIEKQLASEKNTIIDDSQLKSKIDLTEELTLVAQQLDVIEQSEKETRQRYSEVVVKIQEIEQNGTYSALRHSFENEKAAIRETAAQWVVKAIANDLLNKTIERHREEKLPALIGSISYFFAKLTSNSYKKVILPVGKQSFIVERYDGLKFLAEELSQATAEQLYLSIRLALVKNINNQLHLPIMIDDSFVHFDKQRTSNILRLMEELKQDNQVIYFTCHKHISATYPSENIIDLSAVQAI
ncbi:AAA family ATPase [Metabacillus litoralis]|uniref:AAA family ATPase n=1 Tax=Metabacillus litoralis TaxID=152268 RepID=A0A5C6VWT4_9BACI|nr:AAA family ATPase [Metabacillus litoralis]TXC89721.1 AAA family ATPase [Metabacillus litoralis]